MTVSDGLAGITAQARWNDGSDEIQMSSRIAEGLVLIKAGKLVLSSQRNYKSLLSERWNQLCSHFHVPVLYPGIASFTYCKSITS